MPTHTYMYSTKVNGKGKVCGGKCVIVCETQNTITIKPQYAKEVTLLKSCAQIFEINKGEMK